MKKHLTPFDMADYLTSDETIAEYLSQVLADGDQDELLEALLEALGHIAKAKGMAQIAKDAGVGRESLYKAFAPGAKPRFETISKVINSLGLTLQITPIVHAKA